MKKMFNTESSEYHPRNKLADPEGGQGVFFQQYWSIIFEKRSQYSMMGHHRPDQQQTFRGRADDGPLLVVFGSSLPHYLKKNVVKVGPPLTKLSGFAHEINRRVPG